MLSESSRGLRRESQPKEKIMVVNRPAIRPAGALLQLLENVPVWQRAEVRMTWAHTTVGVEDIARALGLEQEIVYLLVQVNPLDNARRHRVMPRGPEGFQFAREAMQGELRFSGSTENIRKRWQALIDEVKDNSDRNTLIDVSALTADMAPNKQDQPDAADMLSKLTPAERTAVRLAFTSRPDAEIDDIAKSFSLSPAVVVRLTRNNEGSSNPMNKGELGVIQTKDMFFQDQITARGHDIRDGQAWNACLVQVRRMKNKLLKALDWQLVDALAKQDNINNPLLIEL